MIILAACVIVKQKKNGELSKTPAQLKNNDAEQMLRMMDALDDNNDVQNAYANFNISDEEIEKLC
jgi:transcriptional/translational regulatory protein YebC/TACO1